MECPWVTVLIRQKVRDYHDIILTLAEACYTALLLISLLFQQPFFSSVTIIFTAATAAHTSVLDHLERVGRANELVGRKSDAVRILATLQPIARDEHTVVMLALIRTFDDRNRSALPDAVATEVSRFAPFSAAAERPADADDAVSLWLSKIIGVVNGVLSGGDDDGTATVAPVPVKHDFFSACEDGRGLASVLSYYRPDLVKLDRLEFCSDAAATSAAATTTEAALHSASRASCPCPLIAQDFLAQSPLLRPVALSWMSAVFFKLAELPLSTRLPVEKLPTAVKSSPSERTQTARTTSAGLSRPVSAMSQRPVSRKGHAHNADPTIGTPSPRPLSRRGYTADTIALADTAHIRAPHQTVRSASRPASRSNTERLASRLDSARQSSASKSATQHTKGRSGLTDTEASEIEVSAWRVRDQEIEDENIIRRLGLPAPVDDNAAAKQVSGLYNSTTEIETAEVSKEASISVGQSLMDEPRGWALTMPVEATSPSLSRPVTAEDRVSVPASVNAHIDSEPGTRTIASAYPAQSMVSSHTVGDAESSSTDVHSALPSTNASSSIPSIQPGAPTETSLGFNSHARSEFALSHSTSGGPPRLQSERKMRTPSPPHRRRRSMSPEPKTRALAMQLSQSLVRQLGALPLQSDDSDGSAVRHSADFSPSNTVRSRESPAKRGKTPSDTESSDNVEIGDVDSEPGEHHHEVFGDLRNVPAQVN